MLPSIHIIWNFKFRNVKSKWAFDSGQHPKKHPIISLISRLVFLGINKYFELWDSQEYENYLGGSEADFREATEGLGNICL